MDAYFCFYQSFEYKIKQMKIKLTYECNGINGSEQDHQRA